MSKALVPVEPMAQTPAHPRVPHHPSAQFLAHLIATARQAPQTRMRRRAEPGDAVAAYGTLDHRPVPPGIALSRSL